MLRDRFLSRAFASILLPLFLPVAAWSQTGPAPGTYVYASCGIGSSSGGELTAQCRREAPRRNLRDVEFSAAELLATWVEQPEGPFGQAGGGLAFVAPLDPVTGEILTDIADVLPFNVPRISEYGNGPEWGLSQRGPEVYLTCRDQTLNQPSLCRITRRSDGAWRILQLANSAGFMSKDPSRNADSATPKIHYEIKGPGPKIYGWREDSPEGSDERIEDGLVSGRWMSDGLRLLLTGFGVGPSEVNRNLFILDTETGESTPLFSDGKNRSFGFPWSAPELDGDDAIVLRTDPDPEAGVGTDIEVYRRDVDGDWVLWNRLPDICPGYPYTSSPEPFVFAGRSYVTMVSYTEGEKLLDPGVIWMASVDPDLPPDQQVRLLVSPQSCGQDPINRRDPEAVVLSDGAGLRIYFLLADIKQ